MEQMIEQSKYLLADLYDMVGLDPSWEFLGNTVLQYTVSFLVFVLAFALFKIVQKLVMLWLARVAERTPTTLDDTFVKMVRSFRPPFYAFLAFWLAFQFLELHGALEKVLTAAVVVWAVYQAVIAVGIMIDDVVLGRFAKDKDPTTRSALSILTRLAKGAIWGLGVILLLSNLGVDVTGLLAGVGIGGIAIAFALQGILADLFSSFSIYFDKPFKVGDFIIVGDKLGTVEHIGVKSTRLRALSGEELVLSNQFLTGAQIQNFKKMEERRVVFQLGVTYDTSVDQVQKAVGIVQQAIEEQELARLDRAHFSAFGDFALKIEAVYYEKSPEYNVYMDTQQAINITIKRRFEEEGIQMALPTQTIHMARE